MVVRGAARVEGQGGSSPLGGDTFSRGVSYPSRHYEIQQQQQRCTNRDAQTVVDAAPAAAPAAEMRHQLQRCSANCRDAASAAEMQHQL